MEPRARLVVRVSFKSYSLPKMVTVTSFHKFKVRSELNREDSGARGSGQCGLRAHSAMPRHQRTHQPSTNIGRDLVHAQKNRKNKRVDLCKLNLPTPPFAPKPMHTNKLHHHTTNLALELNLAKRILKIRTRLQQTCRELGMKRSLRPLSFERWRFDAKFEELDHKNAHPVLPGLMKRQAPPPSARALADEIRHQGLMLTDANAAVDELVKLSTAEAQADAKERHRASSGKLMQPPPVKVSFHRHSVDLACGARFVKVTHAAYARLAVLHRRSLPSEATPAPAVHTLEDTTKEDEKLLAQIDAEVSAAKSECDDEVYLMDSPRQKLHNRMFTLLLRYKSLRGHGYQAAIGPKVWQILVNKLGVGFECFASPLNCHLPRFASGFPDVDAAFGTSGNFFTLKLSSGSFAVNPPFVLSILAAAAQRVIQLLDDALSRGESHALSFVFFMPGWKESQAYSSLSKSRFLRRHFVVSATDHGFCDGASHQRQDPFRQSPYDTAVFILQTERASAKWHASDDVETALRGAMADCLPLASAEDRQSKKRRLASEATRKRAMKKKVPREEDGV